MQPKNKKLAIWIIAIISIVIVINTVINIVVENKIEKAISNFPPQVTMTYKSLSVNIWLGNATFELPNFKVTGQTTEQTIMQGQVKRLSVNNLSLWDYLVNSKMSVKGITIEKPIIRYTHDDNRKGDAGDLNIFSDFRTAIYLDKFLITDADIIIVNAATDAILFSCPYLNFELTKVQFKPSKTLAKSSFDYKGIQINAQELDYNFNTYETLKIDAILVSDDFARCNKVNLKTRYSKSELAQIRAVERDHFDVEIKEISIKDMNVILSPNVSFKSTLVILIEPVASIYRDKRLADDLTEKSLYSRSLRELGFKLGIDEVEIENGKLVYEEQVKTGNQSGSLRFSEMQVNIKNLGNQYTKEETTEIKIATNFMETTPLEVDWKFVVQDSTDQFTFEADLGYFEAESINSFSVPNLSARFTGDLNQIYFTISGGPYRANIDLKMHYEAFKVSLLDDEGKEEKKFLSGLLNLFVKKNSDSGSQDFRFGYADGVERDRTKSIFNFIWLNTQDALLSALTNGHKEED